MSAMLTGPSRKPLSGTPKRLCVILHGWGADGANLIDLADSLAPDFPDAQWIAPNAPAICEVNPYGYQWFSLMDRNPAVLLEGAREAAIVLNVFLDAQLSALNLDDSALALIGFSQGTMLALHTALRREHAIAGIVGFSGALLGAETLADECRSKPPVCLIHGEQDEVVPFSALRHATGHLQAAGIPVETHARPFLGHGIDMEGLERGRGFLKRVWK